MLKSILKAAHFKGLQLQMTEKGLQFSARIDDFDRELEAGDPFDDWSKSQKYLKRIAKLRPFTQVVLNPVKPSAEALKKQLCESQKRLCPNERIAVAYGLPKGSRATRHQYDRRWTIEREDDLIFERQWLVLVAFAKDKPVAYLGMKVSIERDASEREIFLTVSMELVYTSPEHRGVGCGLDLSIAAGWLVSDLIQAIYRAAPPWWQIGCSVNADYESEGGKAIVEQVFSAAELRCEYLATAGKRPSIGVAGAELDAGW